ncbi:uncharacterized protein LOC113232300 [Hyposmocoma kahamanoa]|uniref:uncharacterized protein LOC113232300 n=1 Tax=Hyposmocoma kahamanoa TaxID=1477025 RepID=UPI000E6D8941|nr:uncharacterized protein LOC113232300 [Hyposmocoma kahamanoa]
MKQITLFMVFLLLQCACGVMIKRQCGHEEIHRSCVFYEEYTCWEREDGLDRVRSPPKRLTHCKADCFCRKGSVRAYPKGPCIPAVNCRNAKLMNLMDNLPNSFGGFD